MQSLNLGVVAHVDAGKTSLTERLLFEAGVIDAVGRVDDGSTRTDSLTLEQQRGITIRSAVASFSVAGTTVNLVDTPGHSDFIAEVERALGVLDGAVLVVSAVEGVQAQTRVLMRALQRLKIPTLFFVNKIDRSGAEPDRVVQEITERLTPDVVVLGRTHDAGRPAATYAPYDDAALPVDAWADVLGRRGERLLEAYVAGRLTSARLRNALAEQSTAGHVHPVLTGSAITGAGVPDLLAALPTLLPSPTRDERGPLHGRVFKVERGSARERVAYVDVRSGTLNVRDRMPSSASKVTAIRVFHDGVAEPRSRAAAGEVAQVWGLSDVRIGDEIGAVAPCSDEAFHFAPPSLETVVDPVDDGDRGAMYAGLSELAEQDPLIGLRQDDVRSEIAVSLYGEVQKEVIASMLATDYGVDVTFRETTTICIERPTGTGAAYEVIAVPPNPFLATVGLRVERAPVGSGNRVELEVELGSMPPAFFTAVEQAVEETLREGLRGWAVTDCLVTVTHSGYWARQSHSHGSFDASMSSTAGDFRQLTPLVLMDALRGAGTVVCEPLHRFEVEIPEDCLGVTLALLSQVRAVPLGTRPRESSFLLCGDVPAAQVHALQQRLPSTTRGEGVLVTAFDRYEPARVEIADRARVQPNPLDRRGYLTTLGRWHG
ncbi:elongation factor G [Luteipulveratus flavus]|uniref:TetM/TetW/TetO/TetS family tetracycline resistance ribosomal protection protein n=1 Tax=Luteipulveratus flavus TaxID=3031728 RepID=A0ABT6C4W7_9MICO|nr:TetM/TetW/TetO/TetS family tetracycline resistance ribosomal protection protein [Luteipulveratus sp. YIM 133296]MDF8263593.1 TetM/TetW/TetO/TetS family tetracycline resistance ribosomal protection protein [Luteipulveratus sp. YIM 133296]